MIRTEILASILSEKKKQVDELFTESLVPMFRLIKSDSKKNKLRIEIIKIMQEFIIEEEGE